MYSIIAQGQTSVLRKANFMKWINVICALILFALPAQAATVRYQHTDMLGSVVSESDESGNIISRSQYEPFGKRMGGDKEGIGYTGHLQDKDLGLTYMQARYYDPLIGRFYSNDPVGFTGESDTFNRYSYVANNPYKYTDPTGNAKEGRFAKLVKLWRGSGPSGEDIADAIERGDMKSAQKILNEYVKTIQGPPHMKKGPDTEKANRHGDKPGQTRVKVRNADGTVKDMTDRRVKEDEHTVHKEPGDKQPKIQDKPQGNERDKRDPTPEEKEIIRDFEKREN